MACTADLMSSPAPAASVSTFLSRLNNGWTSSGVEFGPNFSAASAIALTSVANAVDIAVTLALWLSLAALNAGVPPCELASMSACWALLGPM